MARPSLAITLTRLPRSWEPVQKLMSRFSKTVRRRGISARYAYNLEPNPNDRTGAHCHLWWRGDPVNQPLLSEIAAIAGMGSHVDVRPARAETVHHAIPTIDYGLKQILRDRPEHPAELWPSAREYLDLNGGRLICEGLLSSGRSKCRPVLCRAALLSWAGGRASWRSGSATRCRD